VTDHLPPPPDEGDDLPAADAAAGDEVPFGLEVLAEVPELALLLRHLVDADRLIARAVELIVKVQSADLPAVATGVPLEQWLAIVASRTSCDRRMLATAARMCGRLPALADAFYAGELSWSQLRAIVLKVHRLPSHLDGRLDAELAKAITATLGDGHRPDADPDALARIVDWTLAVLHPADDTDPDPTGQDVLVLQPRLDGTGGKGWFDLGAVGFAAVDSATDPGPTGTACRELFGDRADRDRAATVRRTAGRARAANLVDLCLTGTTPTTTGHHEDTTAAGATAEGEASAAGRDPRPPALLLRAELSSLLGQDGLPAGLLTTLAGGTMHVDAATARRLVDRYGADLRLVLLEDGHVVGVGRKTRRPTGWIADAVLALHDTCSELGCQVAARVCDLDHATPVAAGGRTDLATLVPLCGTANHRKETGGWRATQSGDGIRTWTHPRTGLAVRTIPGTWRPPDTHRPPEHQRHTRPPPEGSPSTHDGPTRDGPARQAPITGSSPRAGPDEPT
jgi:hypothetical protein